MDARTATDRLVDDLEGNYFTNLASDRGGATNRGITQKEYDASRLARSLPMRSVAFMDPSEMYEIYDRDYWIPSGGGRLPDGLDYAVFQAGVNVGPQQAVKMLQRLVDATPDGIMGPLTLAAVAAHDKQTLINAFLDSQKAYYNLVVQHYPDQAENLQGWYNRITKVAAYLGQHKQVVGMGLFLIVAGILAAKTLR